MKKVRIYGTMGPACSSPEIMGEMLREGMDGFRLNLSHTTLEGASELIEAFHLAARRLGRRPELLIDMQGPELRIGDMTEKVALNDGDLIDIRDIPFPKAVTDVLLKTGSVQDILLDDGKILMRAERKSIDGEGHGGEPLYENGSELKLKVIRGGILEQRKSIALPGCTIRTPAMTDGDREQIRHARSFGVTAVMQPFVRGREDLIEVRRALDDAGSADIRLLAKIENIDGMNMIDDLIPYCDEIVIARGDLGSAMELWELPAAQKRISALCRRKGRDFMVVTQMLDSMTHRQIPTRAEVSDIFNAVMDGAASVMVTGETAAGEYPALVIRYLTRTVREAEMFSEERSNREEKQYDTQS